jgi:hypothetical protein
VSDECAEMRRLSTWAADDLQGAGSGVVTDASTAAAAGAYLQRQMVRLPALLEPFFRQWSCVSCKPSLERSFQGSCHHQQPTAEHLPEYVPRPKSPESWVGC